MDRKAVTELLERTGRSDQKAVDELFSLLYDRLRAMAGAFMRRERKGHTLQPTALVNEAYPKLLGADVAPEHRTRFLAMAARAMRQVLVDAARKRKAEVHGGKANRVPLETGLVGGEARGNYVDALDLEAALEELAAVDQRKCRVVELRYFGGLEIEEIAKVLEVTPRTVARDWSVARLFLLRELSNKETRL